MTKQKIVTYAFLESAGTFIYIAGVSWLLFNGEKFFNPVDNFAMPMTMLLLFVFSAAITSSLVLGQPLHLYLSGNKKGALQLLIATLIFLFLFTLLAFVVQMV